MFVSSDDLVSLIARYFSENMPSAIGVAVSGGSDSMALLRLSAEWADQCWVSVFAVTVDHGLRPEAKAEARLVAEVCADLGVSHQVLSWQGWDGLGNLQAEARKARYRLLADWARGLELDEVLIGHTQDDQAETFLIRLGRKSGVEGLAAMRSRFERDGQTFGRPLLAASREQLRRHLRAHGAVWCEDASNSDPMFERVRMREALKQLGAVGLTAETLAAVAENLGAAREALAHYTQDAAETCCAVDRGDVVIAAESFLRLPGEITHRILGAALKWISGADYAPRSEAIAKLRVSLAEGQASTLAGCLATRKGGDIRLAREAAAVKDLVADRPEWDRWRIDGPWKAGMQIRALGECDLIDLPGWRENGLPRTSLLSSPALWYDGNLIAAPLAGFTQGFTAQLLPNRANLPVLGV